MKVHLEYDVRSISPLSPPVGNKQNEQAELIKGLTSESSAHLQ
jgi:hypothetical protein